MTTRADGTAADQPPSELSRRLTVLMGAAVVAVCISYALVVAPGLPYDEPSHYGYVRFVEQHWALPVLGNPSVGYEAQMGPVAYFFYAAVLKVWLLVGGDPSHGIQVVRLAGLLPLAAAVACCAAIVRRCRPLAPPAVRWTALAVGLLNPMIVAMSMSVQNDTLAIALGAWMLLLCLDDAEEPRLSRALGLGLIGGVAVLTKLVVLPAVVVLLAWPLLRHRLRGLTAVIVSSAAASVVCGWWFVRNLVLYDDLTAREAVRVTGAVYSPASLPPVDLIMHVARELLTYVTVPVEYYRNVINLPTLLGVALCGVYVAVAVLAVRRGGGATFRPALPFLVAGVSLLAWIYAYTQLQSLPPRAAYAALPALVLIVVAALLPPRNSASRGWVTLVLAWTFLALLHTWTLLAVLGVASPGLIA